MALSLLISRLVQCHFERVNKLCSHLVPVTPCKSVLSSLNNIVYEAYNLNKDEIKIIKTFTEGLRNKEKKT